MRILVTGGTGVVGKPAVDALLAAGHTVRLLSRNAERDAAMWTAGVEPRAGNIGVDADVEGAAEGCDAVLHAAAVVDEMPPEVTFEKVNVEGTRRVVREAERAGVKRLVYVSSLGADRGASGYHRSKRAGELITAEFSGSWLVLRPGNVYGAGDQVVSMLLKLVRILPVIPMVGGGKHPFQPIAAADLARALVLALERAEPTREMLDLAGDERVTTSDLLDLLEKLTGRHPQRVPVPEMMAIAGTRLADLVGVEIPVNADQITMLLEENVIPEGGSNALTEVFGITPTPLEDGLRRLADELPEKLPSDGVGEMQQHRYWGDIEGSDMDADQLFETVRTRFPELLPTGLVDVGVEPGTPVVVQEGATLTMSVPLRGHIQVRVEQLGDRRFTCVTVEGHHLAGAIRFAVRDLGERLRFEIRSYFRASDFLDSVGMATLGHMVQKQTWKRMVDNVIHQCGGASHGGVQEEIRELDERQAARIERWVDALVKRRQRGG